MKENIVSAYEKKKLGNNDRENFIHSLDEIKHSIDKDHIICLYKEYYEQNMGVIDDDIFEDYEGSLEIYENWLGNNFGDKKG